MFAGNPLIEKPGNWNQVAVARMCKKNPEKKPSIFTFQFLLVRINYRFLRMWNGVLLQLKDKSVEIKIKIKYFIIFLVCENFEI